MTENTGEIEVGEGVLWRSRVEPTSFTIHVADPVAGQVAVQTRLQVQGRDTLAAVRLKVDRGRISEIGHLQAGNIAPQAIELLTTPRTVLTEDVPAAERAGRRQRLTFSVRGGQIRHVEAFPFVTLPYGLGNGWTPGSGR